MAQIIAFLKIIQDGVFPHQKSEPITTTNLIFRLHTKYVSTAFIVTASLLFIQQLFADHLKCVRPPSMGTAVESTPLNQYCYTVGTYSIRNESDSFFDKGEVSSVTQFHQYFMWVPFILLVQGIVFHLPQLAWKKLLERGRLAAICVVAPSKNNEEDKGSKDVTDGVGDTSTREMGTQTSLQTSTPSVLPFSMTIRSALNQRYFYGYLACEIHNLLIVIVSIFVTDWFLGGRFFLLGLRWVSYLHRLRGGSSSMLSQSAAEYLHNVEMGNPLESAFPTLFTCHWEKPMDSSVTFAISCILAQNVTHQRIYLLFWLVFFLLFCLGISNLIYRLVLINSSKLRVSLIERQLVKKCVRNPIDLHDIIVHLSVGDWFVLKRILNNVDPDKFDAVVQQVKDALRNSKNKPNTPLLLTKGSQVSNKNGVEVVLEMQPRNENEGL